MPFLVGCLLLCGCLLSDLRSTDSSTKEKIVVSCCTFGFRNRHGEPEGLGFYQFLGDSYERKEQTGSGHKEKELETVQTLENLWQANKESEK